MKFSVYVKENEPTLIKIPFYGYNNKPMNCMAQITVFKEKKATTYNTFEIVVSELMIDDYCDTIFRDGPLHIIAKRSEGYPGEAYYEVIVQYSENLFTRLVDWFWNQACMKLVEVFKL